MKRARVSPRQEEVAPIEEGIPDSICRELRWGTVCSGGCSGCGDLRRGCWLGDAGEREVLVRGCSMECSVCQAFFGLVSVPEISAAQLSVIAPDAASLTEPPSNGLFFSSFSSQLRETPTEFREIYYYEACAAASSS